VRPVPGGALLRLRVTPKARHGGIAGVVADADGGGALKVAVTAAADRGAANRAVLASLAEAFDLRPGDLAIVGGAGARRKTVRISGDGAAIARRIEQWLREHHD